MCCASVSSLLQNWIRVARFCWQEKHGNSCTIPSAPSFFWRCLFPSRDATHIMQGCIIQFILNSNVQVKWNYGYSISYKRVLRPVQIQGMGYQMSPLNGVWPVHILEKHVGRDILLWTSLENMVRHTWFAA